MVMSVGSNKKIPLERIKFIRTEKMQNVSVEVMDNNKKIPLESSKFIKTEKM